MGLCQSVTSEARRSEVDSEARFISARHDFITATGGRCGELTDINAVHGCRVYTKMDELLFLDASETGSLEIEEKFFLGGGGGGSAFKSR